MIFSDLIKTETKNRYKLTIVRRFDFSSKFQSNSVIVKNNLDESYRYFIKGAPEKIIQICNPETLPHRFSEELFQHTQNGYRVLACATKPLPDSDDYSEFEDRNHFENDLIFLGFVVFKNKLKRDTKHIIGKLKESNINLIMATGDNPFTSISVSQECGLVESNKEIYFCNLEKDKDKDEEKLKWYNVNIKKENIIHKMASTVAKPLRGKSIIIRGSSF
jgi:cation-transporting ATPase 13A3/4/5